MSEPTLCIEDDVRVRSLRFKLDEFYERTTDYLAFQGISDHRSCWGHIRTVIDQVLAEGGKCRVLEVGAGRTGFARSLGECRSRVHFIAQDVTGQNKEFLEQEADAVHVGDIATLETTVDIVFSTFVLEHVTNPRRHLEDCWARLRPGGTLFIFCPRYDFPGYLSHSADHRGALSRARLAAGLLFHRFVTLLTSRPAFLVHVDPSVFHLPWAIDRDAVHWVSLFDLRCLFAGRGKVRPLKLSAGAGKDWIVKRWLQVAVMITNTP